MIAVFFYVFILGCDGCDRRAAHDVFALRFVGVFVAKVIYAFFFRLVGGRELVNDNIYV